MLSSTSWATAQWLWIEATSILSRYPCLAFDRWNRFSKWFTWTKGWAGQNSSKSSTTRQSIASPSFTYLASGFVATTSMWTCDCHSTMDYLNFRNLYAADHSCLLAGELYWLQEAQPHPTCEQCWPKVTGVPTGCGHLPTRGSDIINAQDWVDSYPIGDQPARLG